VRFLLGCWSGHRGGGVWMGREVRFGEGGREGGGGGGESKWEGGRGGLGGGGKAGWWGAVLEVGWASWDG